MSVPKLDHVTSCENVSFFGGNMIKVGSGLEQKIAAVVLYVNIILMLHS